MILYKGPGNDPFNWRARPSKDTTKEISTSSQTQTQLEATISQLRRDLRESELREKVYQEEAEETRLRLAKSMAEARILKRELESNRDSGPREVKEAARCWHCTRPTSGPASKRELKEVELSTPLLPGLASELEGELKDMQQELREARQRLRDAEQTLGDAVDWADSMREKEIEGSNMFLDQGRMRLPEADVVQTVKAVNESIFEMARHLAGIIVYDPLHLEGAKKEEFFGRTEFTAAYQRASILGEDLADGLVYKWIHRREREGINPWLVRTVMQFALTHWCVDIWSMDWQRAAREFNGEVASQDSEDQHTVFSNPIDGIARQKDHHSFIADLYETICIHENQTIASRWRSLTSTYLPLSTQGWGYSLMSLIAAIMMIAGWDSRSNDFFDQIKERLGSIFEPLLRLHKAIGEVRSTDLALITVSPGKPFDPTFMEDVYDYRADMVKPQYSTLERVGGMSGLGLRRVVPAESKIGGVPRGWDVLLKPKVLLERSLEMELEPRKLSKRKNEVNTSGDD